MPPGLTMSATGLITGTTPEVAVDTTYSFTVTATNAGIATHAYTWTVKAPIFLAITSTQRWYAPAVYSTTHKIQAVIVG